MNFIFCQNPLARLTVDPDYEAECRMVNALGYEFGLIDFEAAQAGNYVKALRRITFTGLTIYRGWMMSAIEYQFFYQALAANGCHLINTPNQYQHAHWLPKNYGVIEAHTPRSEWLNSGSMKLETMLAAAQSLGDGPYIVKDYVKSEKAYWNEACFIPSLDFVQPVVSRFVELRGPELEGGLVFREYVPLADDGLEYRIFYLDGEPIYVTRHEGSPLYSSLPDPMFNHVAHKVDSRFFTMDVARRADTGEWMIMELGDGQVAGLEGSVDRFYDHLTRTLKF